MIHFMSNSVQAVKDKLRNISKEKNVDFNFVLRFYMYDRFIERLSKSKYKDNFILKGGFYLSKLFGIDNRSTMDIDTAIRKTKFTEENIIKIITEIINVDVYDNVILKIEKVEPIRDEDEYGGLRVTISFSLENIKDKFHIDIVTGDPIYPGPNNFSYEPLIGDKVYKIWSYNLETVLAEKIETILTKLETSSRMKDYYDIYLIHNFKFNKLNKQKFRTAVEKTFKKRNFDADLITNLNIIKSSTYLRKKWISYAKKNDYARNLDFSQPIKCLEDFIEILIKITV